MTALAYEIEIESDLAAMADPESNPNSMPDADYQVLVRAIRENGFLQPVLLLELGGGLREIVDGVHRVRAAREVGLDRVPAIVLPEGTPRERAKILQVGMNRLRGELDLVKVAGTLGELLDGDWDVSLSGFDGDQIRGLLDAMEPPNTDDFDDGMSGDSAPGSGDGEGATFTLEILLDTAAELKAAKKALRKAGGRGNKDLAVGLRAALGLEG